MAPTIDTGYTPFKVHKYPGASNFDKASSNNNNFQSSTSPTGADPGKSAAVAERMNTAVRDLGVDMRDANRGFSRYQVAQEGLELVKSHLQGMRSLAVKSSETEDSSKNRKAIETEFSHLNSQLADAVSVIEFFDGEPLLDTNGLKVNYQLGPIKDDEHMLQEQSPDANSETSVNHAAERSQASIEAIDTLLNEVDISSAEFGAIQDQFESQMSDLQRTMGKQFGAVQPIVDSEHAMETAMLTRTQLLQQPGEALSSQANVNPESTVRLLS